MSRLSTRGMPMSLVLIGLLSTVGVVHAKTTIRFLGNWYNTPDQISIFKDLVRGFNESQSSIKVELTMGGSDDKLRAMMASGTVPDILEFERSKVSTYAREGLFAQVEPYLGKSMNLKKDFLPHTLQEASWKGKIYAVPLDTDVRGLFWNKRLLNEAGLDSINGPRTWAGLREYAVKLTKKGSNGKLEQVGLVPWNCNWNACGWIWSFKGDLYDYNTGKPSLNCAANLKTFNWLNDYAKTVVSPNQLTNSFSFAKEKVAMEPSFYGALDGVYLFANPKLLPNIWGGEVPHPEGGQNGTWAGGLSYVIPSGAKHKKEAGVFITWLMSQANQMRWYKETRNLPPSLPVLEKVRTLMSPLEQIFSAQLPHARWRPPFFNELLGYLDTAAVDVVTGKRSPQAALDYAQNSALRQHPSFWREKIPYTPIPDLK